jgi:hypothetical protein
MSTATVHEINYDSSGLKSLLALDAGAQVQVNKVLADLGSYIEDHPDRVFRDHNNQLVYRHAEPPVEITYELDEQRGVIKCSHVTLLSFSTTAAFISYCHKNTKSLQEFRKYMQSLEEQGLIKFWHDGAIESSADWHQEIQGALRSCGEAILLVTEDFMASQYIAKSELTVLKERFEAGEIRVHWLHIEEAVYEHMWFAKIQALHAPNPPLLAMKRAKRLAAFKQICGTLRERLLKQALDRRPN